MDPHDSDVDGSVVKVWRDSGWPNPNKSNNDEELSEADLEDDSEDALARLPEDAADPEVLSKLKQQGSPERHESALKALTALTGLGAYALQEREEREEIARELKAHAQAPPPSALPPLPPPPPPQLLPPGRAYW